MKKIALFATAALAFFCTGVSAQDGQPAKPDPDAIKLARELLTAAHAEGNIQTAIDAMTPTIVEQLKRDKADIPDVVIQKFIVIFRQEMQDDMPRLLDMEAEIYARHYSLSELRAIANFYESDIGKKMITETPLILKDTIALGQMWGKSTGERAAQDTLAKLRAEGVKI